MEAAVVVCLLVLLAPIAQGTTGQEPTPHPEPVPDPGFMCYACTVNGGDPDLSCYTSPSKDYSVVCTEGKSCTIKSILYSENGQLFSFLRGCWKDQGDQGCVDGGGLRSCQTYCKGDFCNSGDGSNPPTPPTANQI